MAVKIQTTLSVEKCIKKLHPNAKKDLDEAVRTVMSDVSVGEQKKGDLDFVRVYKFKMVNQLTLLAYHYEESNSTITLLSVGSHGNFYRDLKSAK